MLADASRARAAACLALSAALHAALLSGLGAAGSASDRDQRAGPALPLLLRLAEGPARERPTSHLETARKAPAPPPPEPASEPVPAVAPAAAATGVVAALPPPYYYAARELDVRPEPIEEIELPFPGDAPKEVTRGRVVLRLMIHESGSVDAVVLVSAQPAGVFESAAVKAFSAARFTPGMKDGVPVKSQKLVDVVYRIMSNRLQP